MKESLVNTPLNIFSWPLAHLILCGGKGLPPAWGPVLHTDPMDGGPGVNTGEWAWNPNEQRCVRRDRAGYFIFDGDRRWSLPLDDDSPWPARLALVAAWMLRPALPGLHAAWLWKSDHVILDVFAGGRVLQMNIDPETGGMAGVLLDGVFRLRHLPTLPAHLTTLPPVAALLLALYDVPEIRARVEVL